MCPARRRRRNAAPGPEHPGISWRIGVVAEQEVAMAFPVRSGPTLCSDDKGSSRQEVVARPGHAEADMVLAADQVDVVGNWYWFCHACV